MSDSPKSALSVFRTGPISELGGHILLFGACGRIPDNSNHIAVREFGWILPNSEPPQASRIRSVYGYGADHFLQDTKKESVRLCNTAKSNFREWARKEKPDLLVEIYEAIREGEFMGELDLFEMHGLGLMGDGFCSLGKYSQVQEFRQLASKPEFAKVVYHTTELLSALNSNIN